VPAVLEHKLVELLEPLVQLLVPAEAAVAAVIQQVGRALLLTQQLEADLIVQAAVDRPPLEAV